MGTATGDGTKPEIGSDGRGSSTATGEPGASSGGSPSGAAPGGAIGSRNLTAADGTKLPSSGSDEISAGDGSVAVAEMSSPGTALVPGGRGDVGGSAGASVASGSDTTGGVISGWGLWRIFDISFLLMLGALIFATLRGRELIGG